MSNSPSSEQNRSTRQSNFRTWIHKIHQRHDERHHPGENRHAGHYQPLLQEQHAFLEPDERYEAEEDYEIVAPEQTRLQRFYAAIAQIGEGIRIIFVLVARHGRLKANTMYDHASSIASSACGVVVRNQKSFLVLLCFLLVVLSVGEAMDIILRRPPPKYGEDVCTTPACIYAASNILENLHPDVVAGLHSESSSVDPCGDFDKYVCGGFHIRHDVHYDQTKVTVDSMITKKVQSQIRKLLGSEESLDRKDKVLHNMIVDSYNVCMDTEKLGELGLEPLMALTSSIKALFSPDRQGIRKSTAFQMSLDLASPNSLTAAFLHMMRLKIPTFMRLDVQADISSASQMSIHASPPITNALLSSRINENEPVLVEYESLIALTLESFYKPGNISLSFKPSMISPKHLARGIVHLERELATATTPGEQPIRRSLNEFQTLIPQLSIRSVLSELAPPEYNASMILVTDSEFFNHLSVILSETQTEVLQAFMVWQAIKTYASRVEDKVLQPWKNFEKKLEGVQNQPERWQFCTDSVATDFVWIVSKFYVQRHFSSQNQMIGTQVFNDMRNALTDKVAHADWMDGNDQESLENRTKAMTAQIGLPKMDLLRSHFVEEYYKSVVTHSFFEDRIQIARLELERAWSSLVFDPKDILDRSLPPISLVAHYDRSTNEVATTAAIMRNPIFDPEFPDYLNYGAFGGAVLGHEMGHVLRVARWSNNTQSSFTEKVRCITKDFRADNQSPPSELLNGADTDSVDKVAGIVGANVAFAAWTLSNRQIRSQPLLLPGLPFTQEQLFWLAFGGRYCSKTRRNSQSPERRWMRGTVANTPGFQQAFHCPPRATCDLF